MQCLCSSAATCSAANQVWGMTTEQEGNHSCSLGCKTSQPSLDRQFGADTPACERKTRDQPRIDQYFEFANQRTPM